MIRKGNQEVVTLGIGDGANDVEMIRAAHIGVGIIGKEGSQAVNNADYAISQFRYLARLILVYGHRSYRGITLASLFILYKNILYTFTQFFFTFLCGFSGTRNQTFLAVMFFNTIFTAFSPFYLGVLDRDVNDANCYRFPQLHRQGIDHKLFDFRIFILFTIKSVIEALVITFVTEYSLLSTDYNGSTIEVYTYGTIQVTLAILIANTTGSIILSGSTTISRVAYWVCFLCWLLGLVGISQLPSLMPYYYKLFTSLIMQPATYLTLLLTMGVALLPTLIFKAIQVEWYPRLSNIIMDVQSRHANAEQLKEALEEMEKKRSLELELKTIKELPQNADIPVLLDMKYSRLEKRNQSSHESEEEEEVITELPVLENPCQLLKTGNTRRSIRSIAGLRALSICEQLHGPSYDAQSINSDAQNELINKINSHDWRLVKKTSLLDTIKTTIKDVSHVTTSTILSFGLSSNNEESEVAESSQNELFTIPEESTEVVLEDVSNE